MDPWWTLSTVSAAMPSWSGALASASWSLLSSWPSWWSSSDNAVSRSWYSPPAQCGGSPTSHGYAYYYYYEYYGGLVASST
eukprot:1220736-Amphidinium_carterae.1